MNIGNSRKTPGYLQRKVKVDGQELALRKMEKDDFFIVPNDIIETMEYEVDGKTIKLKNTDISLYIYMCSEATVSAGNVYKKTTKELASETGINKNTITTSRERLKEADRILYVDKAKKPSEYTITGRQAGWHKEKSFFMMHHCVVKSPTISRQAKLLYAIFAKEAGVSGEKTIKRKKLAQLARVKDDANLTGYLKELENARLLYISKNVKEYNGQGQMDTKTYYLLEVPGEMIEEYKVAKGQIEYVEPQEEKKEEEEKPVPQKEEEKEKASEANGDKEKQTNNYEFKEIISEEVEESTKSLDKVQTMDMTVDEFLELMDEEEEDDFAWVDDMNQSAKGGPMTTHLQEWKKEKEAEEQKERDRAALEELMSFIK